MKSNISAARSRRQKFSRSLMPVAQASASRRERQLEGPTPPSPHISPYNSSDGHIHSPPNAHTYAYPNANTHTYSNPYSDRHVHAHPNAHRDSHANANTHSYSYRNCDGDCHS